MNIGSVSAELNRLSESRSYLVAYSGGVDSHVLLHLLAVLGEQEQNICLRALHLHHGLSPYADEWALHCEQVCNALAVPFLFKKILIETNGQSWEAAARHERYRILANHLKPEECLVTAHTQDDQAETVLLQLLRGAGPKGLAAMPLRKTFAHSLHLRPLLSFTRDEILVYARENALLWVEDDSNKDSKYDRNYLRNEIMPLLKQRWFATSNNMSRSARHCAQATEILTDVAVDDLLKMQGTRDNTLSIMALLELSPSRRANVLRHWFSQAGERSPSTQQLEQIESDILRCHSDANPVFSLEANTLRRFRDDLYLLDIKIIDPNFEIQWDCRSTLQLPGNLGALSPDQFANFNELTVRFRRGGESIKPAGSRYSHSLKKLFQAWGIPPWERSRIPLLFDKDELIAVVGYCRSF